MILKYFPYPFKVLHPAPPWYRLGTERKMEALIVVLRGSSFWVGSFHKEGAQVILSGRNMVLGVWGGDAYLQISFHCHFSRLRSPIPPQGIGCCCCCFFFFFFNNDVVIVSGEYWRDSAIHIPVCHGLVLQDMLLFSRSVMSDSVTSWTVACQASLPHIWTCTCWCMISGLGIRCDSFFLGLCQGFGRKQLSLQLVSPHLRYPSCGASWESGKNTGLGVGMCSCFLVYIYSLL